MKGLFINNNKNLYNRVTPNLKEGQWSGIIITRNQDSPFLGGEGGNNLFNFKKKSDQTFRQINSGDFVCMAFPYIVVTMFA